uniref:Uncharacterized protein n=1 Tax=Micrurus spixii TaxID=129469 RepID=A0A2D4M968_9SAUR
MQRASGMASRSPLLSQSIAGCWREHSVSILELLRGISIPELEQSRVSAPSCQGPGRYISQRREVQHLRWCQEDLRGKMQGWLCIPKGLSCSKWLWPRWENCSCTNSRAAGS